jgi:tripartite-type tricarboxylate transporter receptor subunit TctC
MGAERLAKKASQSRKSEALKETPMLRLLAASGLILSMLAAADAQTPAKDWPQRNVTLILPLGPGSGVDITTRLLADKLSAKWGKPVVVENRPGGDAIVAINAFVSANDDHTFLMAPTSTFTAHPLLHQKLPYDASDLVPVARATNTLIAIGVPASLGVNTLADFVKLAKEKPGQLNYAGTTGAVDFVVSGWLKDAGIDVAKIPYKDGVQALNDLAEGRIQIYGAAYAIMRPQVASGKVKVLALMNAQRAPALADIPTAKEAGYPSLTLDGLVGLFGSKKMSADVRDKIAADMIEAASDPEVVKKLTPMGQVVRPGPASEFASEIDAQRKIIAESAKRAAGK